MTNAQGIAAERLRSFIERIERLEEEKKAIADDIKEVYSEAKSAGFETKIMRMIVRLRKMDAQERAEQEQLLEVYAQAVGLSYAPVFDAVQERDEAEREERGAGRASGAQEKPAARKVDAVVPGDLPTTKAGDAAKRLAAMAVEDGGTGFEIRNASGDTLAEVRADTPARASPPSPITASLDALRCAMNT